MDGKLGKGWEFYALGVKEYDYNSVIGINVRFIRIPGEQFIKRIDFPRGTAAEEIVLGLRNLADDIEREIKK